MRVLEVLVMRNDKIIYQFFVDVEGFDFKEFFLRLVGWELIVMGICICVQKYRKLCF